MLLKYLHYKCLNTTIEVSSDKGITIQVILGREIGVLVFSKDSMSGHTIVVCGLAEVPELRGHSARRGPKSTLHCRRNILGS